MENQNQQLIQKKFNQYQKDQLAQLKIKIDLDKKLLNDKIFESESKLNHNVESNSHLMMSEQQTHKQ